MIRIERAPEPVELTVERNLRIPRIEGKLLRGEKLLETDFEGYGHKAVRQRLHGMQHRKCCYCEKHIEVENEDVEHFRPKRKANRIPGSRDRSGYWWLTFTWENLFFSCRQCNTKKGFKFPLRAGSGLLPTMTAPAPAGTTEAPLLLQPAEDHGALHIQFCLEIYGERQAWRPRPREGDVRGAYTIRVCRLDRHSLLEIYDVHFRQTIRPYVEDLRNALRTGNKADLWLHFHRARSNLLSPDQQFVAFAYDVLIQEVPNEDLARVDRRLRWPAPDDLPVRTTRLR